MNLTFTQHERHIFMKSSVLLMKSSVLHNLLMSSPACAGSLGAGSGAALPGPSVSALDGPAGSGSVLSQLLAGNGQALGSGEGQAALLQALSGGALGTNAGSTSTPLAQSLLNLRSPAGTGAAAPSATPFLDAATGMPSNVASIMPMLEALAAGGGQPSAATQTPLLDALMGGSQPATGASQTPLLDSLMGGGQNSATSRTSGSSQTPLLDALMVGGQPATGASQQAQQAQLLSSLLGGGQSPTSGPSPLLASFGKF